MTHKKVPAYLTEEQRQIMMEIPTDLDDRDLARYYTLTPEELELVNLRRRPANRFGFAVQLAFSLWRPKVLVAGGSLSVLLHGWQNNSVAHPLYIGGEPLTPLSLVKRICAMKGISRSMNTTETMVPRIGALIQASSFAPLTNELLALLRPAIRLIEKERTDDGEIAIGASKLGGLPDLPPEQAWPMTDDGKPLSLVAQIRLSDQVSPSPQRSMAGWNLSAIKSISGRIP